MIIQNSFLEPRSLRTSEKDGRLKAVTLDVERRLKGVTLGSIGDQRCNQDKHK